nr:hypothetical protein GQ55_3G227300 [Ipomoea trifida]
MAADGENGVAMAIHEDDLMGVAGIVIHPKHQAAVGANHRETITAKHQRFSPNLLCRSKRGKGEEGMDIYRTNILPLCSLKLRQGVHEAQA